MSIRPGRRAVLRGAGAAALLSTGAVTLGACSGDSESQRNTTLGNRGVTLPTYRPFDLVKPDLRGTDAGVPDAFLELPSPPVRGTQEKPAQGGSITAMAQFAYAPPPPGRP